MTIQPILSAQLLCLAFLAILFLQSGLDKVFNYKGNLSWFKDHFKKSPLRPLVPIITPVITVLEVMSGVFAGLGLVFLLLDGSTDYGLLGAQLSSLSIVALFFGQRLAQDYVGAATLTTYFIISIMSIYLLTI